MTNSASESTDPERGQLVLITLILVAAVRGLVLEVTESEGER